MDRIFLIFVCIIAVFSLSAQSAYLDGTSKSFNVGGALLDTKEQSYFTVAPGFTFGGKWNIGVNIGRGKIKAYDQGYTGVTPYISYSILKQGINNNPVTLTAGIAYAIMRYDNIEDFTVSAFEIGLGLNHKFNISDNLSLIPGAYILWDKYNYNSWYGSESVSLFRYEINAVLLFNMFYVGPLLNIVEGSTIFVLKFGLVIPY